MGTLFYNFKKKYLFSPESFRLVCPSGCVWSANSKAHLCSDCGVLSDIPCVLWAWGFHFIHHFQRIPSVRSTEGISVTHTRVRWHLCVHTYMCMCPHESNHAWQRDTLQLCLNSCDKLHYPVPFSASPALSSLSAWIFSSVLNLWEGFQKGCLKNNWKKSNQQSNSTFFFITSSTKKIYHTYVLGQKACVE